MEQPIAITFVLYLIFLLGVGLYFWRKNQNIEDYLLGGRGMGAWVTALSAQASDMSGWLLMGLPGAIYLSGLVEAWIAVGLFVGTALNWLLVSGRLRLFTKKTDTITLPSFFEARFHDPTGLLRIVSALIILVFFTLYASSGLKATGHLFESTFSMPYHTAVIVGGSIIVSYTFLGGFMAVCWTDLIQGLLMLIALIVVPMVAYQKAGGIEAIQQALSHRNLPLTLWPVNREHHWLAVLSSLSWGLGYFGQPHILTRFMSVKSVQKLRASTIIAIAWVFLSLGGAVAIGLISVGLFANLNASTHEHEKVFIYMVPMVMGPWLGGVMLAAILSAIMSTIDSQLLVSSSALTEDFYQKVVRRAPSDKELMLVGRTGVMIISLIALILALNPRDSILGIVAYSWGGFGAAFGPVILFALFSRQTTWLAALLGMIAGAVTLVVWKEANLGMRLLGHPLYEIVPGFLANTMTIVVTNCFLKQKDLSIDQLYEETMSGMQDPGMEKHQSVGRRP